MSAYLGVGDLLDDKYRIVRVIGEGGWGVVYEGENVRTLTRVAIKVLRTHSGVTADVRARFEREAQAGGRIGSEHIVEVFDLGVLPDGTHFMVMELLPGEDLATRLRCGGALDPVIAAKLVVQLLDGLTAAHHAGILHRDLKPENLFLVPTRSGEDFVKILDFGVSKFSVPGMSGTRTGAVLGSPFYMAPEQARGLKHVDGRTDLYSVGALMFECVTGRVPFDGENFNDLMFKIALAPRPNPLHFRPDLDLELASIIVKAIAADPRDRFASAEDFRAALVIWIESQGAGPVLTPDVRRVSRTQRPAGNAPSQTGTTPRDVAASITPRNSAPVAAETAVDTPLSSSSPAPGNNRKQVVLAALSTALALAIGAGVARWGLHRATEAGPGPSAAARALPAVTEPAAAPTSSGVTGTVAAPPSFPVAPDPSEARAAPPAAPPTIAPVSPAGPIPPATVYRYASARPGARPAASPANVASSLPSASSSSEPSPKQDTPPQSASSTPTAQPKDAPRTFEKIEGREVRTGL